MYFCRRKNGIDMFDAYADLVYIVSMFFGIFFPIE